MTFEEFDYSRAGILLYRWFLNNARKLPWRSDPAPYHIWISEIMLQQTRVEAVKPYYARFLAALPTSAALAACPEETYLKLWEGLGYYSRVRNLHKAAQQIDAQYGGALPSDFDELLKLPGIGRYTAGAIASIAYGKYEPAVDGNVLRILARLTGDDADIQLQQTKDRAERVLRAYYRTLKEAAEGPSAESAMPASRQEAEAANLEQMPGDQAASAQSKETQVVEAESSADTVTESIEPAGRLAAEAVCSMRAVSAGIELASANTAGITNLEQPIAQAATSAADTPVLSAEALKPPQRSSAAVLQQQAEALSRGEEPAFLHPGLLNQAMMDLGATVCVPNGEPLCHRCPWEGLCTARREGLTGILPVRSKKAARKIEERTVLILSDGKRAAIRKRPARGLLADLWELPNYLQLLTREEVVSYVQAMGFSPIRIAELPPAKHIFSHVEWHMTGWQVLIEEEAFASEEQLDLRKKEKLQFCSLAEIQSDYAIPSAFSAYLPYLR
ncbi:MAG: NUDIX domain-containing protein [Firmicutes bacterium]|nr:NUDIX domain-containing protein [Bacillota bacterium]